MTIRRAVERITITDGTATATLRPSLRAGYRLIAKYGMGKLYHGIAEGNLSILYDVALEAGGERAATVLERSVQYGLEKALRAAQIPFFLFVGACIGIGDDNTEKHPVDIAEAKGEPFDLLKALTEFFEVGTGWLGWTPEETWNATPAEIMAAQRGNIAKLKAIYGSTDKEAPNQPEAYTPEQLNQIERQGFDPAFDRDGITALKADIAGKSQ